MCVWGEEAEGGEGGGGDPALKIGTISDVCHTNDASMSAHTCMPSSLQCNHTSSRDKTLLLKEREKPIKASNGGEIWMAHLWAAAHTSASRYR